MRKTCACPNCCPDGGAIFEADKDYSVASDANGDYPAIWQCLNCYYTMPRRVQKPRDTSVMSKAQTKTIEDLKRMVVRLRSLSQPDEHEFKEIKTEMTDYGSVWLTLEYGRIGDEGTLAAILCRSRYHLQIGTKGGVTAYGKGQKKFHGVFNAINWGDQR